MKALRIFVCTAMLQNVYSTPLCGHQNTPVSPAPDQVAVSVLGQALQKAGGAATLATFRDFQATGKVTYNWGQAQSTGDVVVRGRGAGQFRVDASLPEGNRSWSVSNGQGFVQELDGTSHVLATSNSLALGALAFPVGILAAALQDTSCNISYVGLESNDGIAMHHIVLTRTFEGDTQGLLSRLSEKHVFVAADSFELLGLRMQFQSDGGRHEVFTQEYWFSDYRAVGQLRFPFAISEHANGQILSTIQLSNINLNNGLTDADFSQ
jgi:hypothetical protein